MNETQKVVITGVDFEKGTVLSIVKKGGFSYNAAGALAALNSGYIDKEGEFPPEFIVSDFETHSSAPDKTECTCIVVEKADNGMDVLNTYTSKVCFHNW